MSLSKVLQSIMVIFLQRQ